MPSIRVEMFEGRTVEQKRVLAKALTDATMGALGVSADSVEVLMFDIPRHDWATAGVLWSDRPSKAAPADSPAAPPAT